MMPPGHVAAKRWYVMVRTTLWLVSVATAPYFLAHGSHFLLSLTRRMILIC